MKLPPFDYACPATLAEAGALLASREGRANAIAVAVLAARAARRKPGAGERT